MALKKGDKDNFQTLVDAAKADRICLMETSDRMTGQYVAVVCATNTLEDGQIEFVPLVKLFSGNPYDELIPPTAEGEDDDALRDHSGE